MFNHDFSEDLVYEPVIFGLTKVCQRLGYMITIVGHLKQVNNEALERVLVGHERGEPCKCVPGPYSTRCTHEIKLNRCATMPFLNPTL